MSDIIAPSRGENIYGFLVVFTIGTFSANIFLSEHFQGEHRTKIGSSDLMTFANVMIQQFKSCEFFIDFKICFQNTKIAIRKTF